MSVPNWSPQPPQWSEETYNLLIENPVKEPIQVTLDELIKKSNDFPIEFPIDSGRCNTLKNFVTSSVLERNINSVYPVIHENVLELCCKFILHKRLYGTALEKSVYKNITLLDFIDRLLTKRAVMFVDIEDSFILLNSENGSDGWEAIGTEEEKSPLTLQNCLSYDEMKLSALLSVSSYTYFVNKGERSNMAKYSADRSDIEDEGIIIGLIGPRLVKENVMEYQEIVINSEQNTCNNGYGIRAPPSVHKLFADFYEEECRDYEETINFRKSLSPDDKRYENISYGIEIFDNYLYYKRLTFSIDTLLLEANYRANLKETTAFIHVVGLGLGVWRISTHQDKVYMETFEKRISQLVNELTSVSDICFSYINHDRCGRYQHGETIPGGHPTVKIKIHIRDRNPHEKLINEDAGKLLVVSYAWDGNALPGNEYWDGWLGNSSDSAAASSTQITELHNPHINPLVCGDSLRVVTRSDVVTFPVYQETIRSNRNKETTDQRYSKNI